MSPPARDRRRGVNAAAAPTVVTNAATSVTTTGGVLNGGVNPNGLATTGWFEWGTSPTLATFSSTASQSLGSGTTSQAVSGDAVGAYRRDAVLLPGGGLQLRGAVEGVDRQFQHRRRTAPTVVTNAATSVITAGGRFERRSEPERAATTGWFEWGTSPTLATFSSTSNQSLGSGTTSQSVSAALSGLTAGTPYYFRVAASNSAGPSKGSIASFSTKCLPRLRQ